MATNDNAFQEINMPTVNQQLQYPLDYVTQEILKQFVNTAYPVGSIYMNLTKSANPSTYLGVGTWASIDGYVIAGYKSGDANFGTAGATVGAATVTLDTTMIPAHTHGIQTYVNSGGAGGQILNSSLTTTSTVIQTASTGGGAAHANIQPTLVAYVWKRTA